MRFVWQVIFEHDRPEGEHGHEWFRYLTAGLVALGILALIVWRLWFD